jgi:hypothetical protein
VNAWKLILAALVIFGSGFVTGGLVGRRTTTVPLPAILRPAETNRPPHFNRPDQARRFDFILRAQHELGLTPEQRDQVEQIVREGQERMRGLWDEFNPHMQACFKEVREQIHSVLTEDQRARFDQLMKQRRPPRPEDGDPRDGRRMGPPPPGP